MAQNTKSNVLIIGIIVFVLIFGLGIGTYIFFMNDDTEETTQENTSNSTTNEIDNTDEPDEPDELDEASTTNTPGTNSSTGSNSTNETVEVEPSTTNTPTGTNTNTNTTTESNYTNTSGTNEITVETVETKSNLINKISIEKNGTLNFSGITLIDKNNNYITNYIKPNTIDVSSIYGQWNYEQWYEGHGRLVFKNNETNLEPKPHTSVGDPHQANTAFHSGERSMDEFVSIEVEGTKLSNLKYIALTGRSHAENRSNNINIILSYIDTDNTPKEYIINTGEGYSTANPTKIFEIDPLLTNQATVVSDMGQADFNMIENFTNTLFRSNKYSSYETAFKRWKLSTSSFS